MGILCSKYVFVTGHSDSCSLRKSGPFCHLLLLSISFGLLPLVNKSATTCGPVSVFCVGSLLDLSHPHSGESIESIGFLLVV